MEWKAVTPLGLEITFATSRTWCHFSLLSFAALHRVRTRDHKLGPGQGD